MAVILILVVAAALIFYAISLNLGRISQTKVMTTVAADTAASTMASYMASFGQSVFMTSLGGDKKVCNWTGVVAAILVVIVAIITIIAPPVGVAMWKIVLFLVLAIGALAMQVAVIQPGLTSAWNDIIWHSMEMKDAFVEQGVQTALSGAATDRVLVPDLDDSDGDRLWGFDGGGQPLDEVSRFGVYYTQRRLNTIPIPVAGSVDDFLDNLRDFLTKGTDTWGLIDDTGPRCDPFVANSECNHCCILPAYWTEEMGCAADSCIPPYGEYSCAYYPAPADVASMRTTCANNSPYGANYPWVYDAYRGNPVNAFVSFQEQIGRDDEHKDFRKNPVDNLLTPDYDGPNGIQAPLPGDGFKLEDTTSFHDADNRTGVFGFFYKIADWGVNLDPTTLVTDNPLNPQCHWCDDNPAGPGVTCDPALQPAEIPQLNLPVDPSAVDPVTGLPLLSYNTTYCVDGEDPHPVPGWPPLAVDLVRLPDPGDVVIPWADGIGKIEADVDQCAQNASGDPASGFWKRGGDRFCSAGGNAWPYWGECPKYGTCPEVIDIDPETGIEEIVDPGCACGETGARPAANWPDDLPDDLVYGLNFFADWAKDLLAGDAVSLGREFKNWYPEAAEWIEPGQSNVPRPVNDPNCTATSCCFVCAAEDGALHKWHKAIQEMKNRLQAWRDTSFAGSQCRDVWCVPPADYSTCTASFPTPPPPGEEATFNVNRNAVRGDMEDVVACINWNANDIFTTSDGLVTATGNAEKFRFCHTACQTVSVNMDAGTETSAQITQARELCLNLPRSLVPGFDASSFSRPRPGPMFRTKGSCGSPGYMDAVDQSSREAKNQVAKFRQRYNYLSGRLNELDGIIAVLKEAGKKFNGFLTCADGPDADTDPDGAACRLIKARIDLDRQETGLPYHAIYGWQDEPRPGDPPGSGRWHIVRADARIPEKCDRACGESQLVDSDPAWPYVDTYTKAWGTKRCYELESTTGVVKARVTRFDETSKFSTLLFPNAVEIWKPTFERGDRPSYSGNINDDIMAACANDAIMIPGPGASFDYYGGAFILNKRLDGVWDPACLVNCSRVYGSCKTACSGNPLCETVCQTNYNSCVSGCQFVSNVDCWDLANRLLASGVTSEACAQYYYHKGTPKGMDFKFVRCEDF